MAPHRFSAATLLLSMQWSWRRCMSSNERARAELDTSPALAFIFSSPIMNSETARDLVGSPWLRNALW